MNVTGFDRFYVGTEPDTYVQEVPVPRPTPEGEQLNYMTYFDDVYTDIPKREAKWYMVRRQCVYPRHCGATSQGMGVWHQERQQYEIPCGQYLGVYTSCRKV